MRAEAETAGCELVFNAPPSIIGSWDRARIRQIANNLISNAIKYGRRQPVLIELSATDSSVTISTTDHGIGIDPEKRQKIFERFERAVSLKNYGGFGIGLFITRNLVEAHGGTIRVDSEVGKGARFTVELPRYVRALAATG
jgi:signal transduction histidine kinase